MTLVQFIQQWNQKRADYDGAFGTQCVDLFNYYNRDVVQAKPIGTPDSGGAKDLWKSPSINRDEKYTRFSVNDTPQPGDVAVWDGTMPGSGGYGHVAIVLNTKPNNQIEVFEQVPGSAAYGTIRSKSHLFGYLRPKSNIKGVQPVAKSIYKPSRADIKKAWNELYGTNPSEANYNHYTPKDISWLWHDFAYSLKKKLDAEKKNTEDVRAYWKAEAAKAAAGSITKAMALDYLNKNLQ